MVASLLPGAAFAAQPTTYRDPAEHWMNAGSRTNELDINAVVSHETFYCHSCKQHTSFTIWRTPEYTRDGQTALTRNVLYSDGTMVDGESTGSILDGDPGVDAFYTGYHWTKSMCDTCGVMNANGGTSHYGYSKNVYNLYDCASGFSEELDDKVTYEYADDTYHTKTVEGGHYCEFCFGTVHTHSSTLERHNLKTEVKAQLDKQRFAVVTSCADCGYTKTEYVAAKSVVADYYGAVDGKAHTLTVSDLSESGVTAKIRYGNSADACTLVTPPSYTEEGQYTVYYAVTYTYKDASMTENGVAYVWLHDESVKESEHPNPSHDPSLSADSAEHNYVYLDTVAPTCTTLGYDRYLCSICGAVDKRNYQNATGHAIQSIVIREADCEHEGKTLEICRNCGEVKETLTPKGEHQYKTYKVAATCTASGYTVKECEICGERQITDITAVKGHSFVANVVAPTCTTGGQTQHTCEDCGESYSDSYTQPAGHDWDAGRKITDATCNGEGVIEYRCRSCNETYLEAVSAKGHNPGPKATCTEDQICKDCGAVIEKAHGHDYEAAVTAPTCTELGYTTYTCKDCGKTYTSDYVKATGHEESDWIVDKEPTTEAEGSRHKECVTCHEKLVTEPISKLYLYSTTDGKGEATVGEYLVIVTDTSSGKPIANAAVELNKDGTISVRFPDGRLLDYGNKTTVFVLRSEDKAPVKDIQIYVTDMKGNYVPDTTDQNGQITVPNESGKTGDKGSITFGGKDADNDPFTITVNVVDGRNQRPIDGAEVSIGKTGTITVVLPDGLDMDENNPIVITVTDQKGNPLDNVTVIVKGDKDKETGKTGEDGTLTLPEVTVIEKHGAYIYGYPDGTFGPSRSMTRAEAAAIFARLLAERKGDTLPETARTKFTDIPANAWYSGYVKYLTGCGIVTGTGDNKFSPNEEITRAEVVAMAVRFFEVYDGGNAAIMEQYAEFNDVSEGYWAAQYIKDAAIHGWIKGYGDGTFRAAADITRAEAVTIINRLLGRIADEDYIDANLRKLTTFSDMTPNHWAYYDVMESANAHIADVTKGESWMK